MCYGCTITSYTASFTCICTCILNIYCILIILTGLLKTAATAADEEDFEEDDKIITSGSDVLLVF